MGDRNNYQYSSFTESDAIRLIVLSPSEDFEADVHCSLEHTSLSEVDYDIAYHYVALSYVWGDSKNRAIIWIDRKSLNITASLESALRHIRHKDKTIRLWADAVCINQEDIEERNQQVSQMGAIYKAAAHTVIFLGQSTPESDQVFRTSVVTSRFTDESLQDTSVIESIYHDVLARPWFTRVWILQELVFSVNAWVQCGLIRIKWSDFLREVHLCMSQKKDLENAKYILLDGMDTLHWRLHGRKLEARHEVQTGDCLLEILASRRGLGATDPRDMIYAHLGVAARLEYLPDVGTLIPIDYGKTCEQIYEEVALQIISWQMSLTILNHLENSAPENRWKGLPSWAPDWSCPKASVQSFFLHKQSRKQCKISTLMPHTIAIPGYLCGTIKCIVSKFTTPFNLDLDILENSASGVIATELNLPNSEVDSEVAKFFPHLLRLFSEFMPPSDGNSSPASVLTKDRDGVERITEPISEYSNYDPQSDEWPEFAECIGKKRCKTCKLDDKAILPILQVLSDIYLRGDAFAFLTNGLVVAVTNLAQIGDQVCMLDESCVGVLTTLRALDADRSFDEMIMDDIKSQIGGELEFFWGGELKGVEHFRYVGSQEALLGPEHEDDFTYFFPGGSYGRGRYHKYLAFVLH
ncbi:hypothetical protein G7Y89_g8567 [Cudoniella acicularis]|uniref:Heterokaryon incompatibility domain-containing protein n=1 Tax=Cudoniella acicularis TaxID=354080 RepID=A0A8H4RIG5_9HELO|nr:hypothetical protein G7Y89_g8567 [Cudoniella acicularis]